MVRDLPKHRVTEETCVGAVIMRSVVVCVVRSDAVVIEPLAHRMIWCSEGIVVLNVDPIIGRTLMSTVDTASSTHGGSSWKIRDGVLRRVVGDHGVVS